MSETIGFCSETRPENCGLVLFGATGDLAARKILPALFGLCEKKLIPEKFYMLLAGRTPLARGDLERRVWDALNKAGLQPFQEHFSPFLERLEYMQADYASPDFYRELALRLAELDARHGVDRRRLFYLATPPEAFARLAAGIKGAGLLADPKDCTCWSRLIVEKPYGVSLEDALALDSGLSAASKQVYRIDHFTGKEAVQNVLALRSANAVFDNTWNSRFVDHVQISVLEDLGAEGREAFFDRNGLARDMMSHILQLAAITAMDLPDSFRDTDFKRRKEEFFGALRPFTPAEAAAVVRGQYAGYRALPGVAPGSTTETFLAFRFFIDNERWRGVPFYVRAGKKTGQKKTGIAVVYKKPSAGIFKDMDLGGNNVFSFSIQPEEKVSFSVIAKHPGPKLCFTQGSMGLEYQPDPGQAGAAPTDYERLLIDAMAGDQTLFLGPAEMSFLWKFLEPLPEAWRSGGASPLHFYADGSEGPSAADELIRRDGRTWL